MKQATKIQSIHELICATEEQGWITKEEFKELITEYYMTKLKIEQLTKERIGV